MEEPSVVEETQTQEEELLFKMKKVLIFILVLLASLTTAFGAQFYDTYELSFSHETPDTVYVEGYECTNSACTDWNTGSPVTIYQGDDAQVCIQNALNNGNVWFNA